MGVCSTTNYTTNINCCFLQILCGDMVIKEFKLSKLMVIDRSNGFILRDNVSTFEFNQLNVLDSTANEVRLMRCDCK